ncbi:Nephrocystin-3 [Durusdinium trenchii]|uniref:Nephrocystin-3 n=1 Tax=Durusdinium trenchii TaxID=1381693 RepID=A0ABP0KER7_9DINO
MDITESLKDYFEISYQHGIFEHPDYEWSENEAQLSSSRHVAWHAEWGWLHQPTGITVWGDALDLTVRAGRMSQGGSHVNKHQVVFHYTNFLAFKNITNEAKEDIELWASLEIEGPTANAWYGRGLYTVPLPPDAWGDINALLDNNYRNMMRRDLQNRGEDYVQKTYPARAKFCIPILVDPQDAYDVSVRPTPEMVERGVPPGYNLKMMPLSEPGMRPRMCITVRIEDEKKNVCNPKAKLLDVVKTRADALAQHGPNRASLEALMRLAMVESSRGLYQEATKHFEQVVRSMESFFGVNHRLTLRAMAGLADALAQQGDFHRAEAYMSMVLSKNIDQFGEEDGDATKALNSLGNIFRLQHKRVEAQEFLRQAFRKLQRRYGVDHPKTLAALLPDHVNVPDPSSFPLTTKPRGFNGLDFASFTTPDEAEALYTEAYGRFQQQLGDAHPDTMNCKMLLAQTKLSLGNRSEAKEDFDDLFKKIKKQLGASHPHTLAAHRGWLIALSEEGELGSALYHFGRELGHAPLPGSLLLLEIFFHFSLRKGLLGVLLLFALGLYLYSPFFVASFLWDAQLGDPSIWLLTVCTQIWLFQVILLLCQVLSPNRRALRSFKGLQINLTLFLCSLLLVIRVWLLEFSWFIVTGPWYLLELLWLCFWLSGSCGAGADSGLRHGSSNQSSVPCVERSLASLERLVLLLLVALRADLAADPEIGRIPWYLICIILFFTSLTRRLLRSCCRRSHGRSISCSQVFRSSIFSCIVTISRMEVLKLQLAGGFGTLLVLCILAGGTYKLYRPQALSAHWVSLPLLILALSPAFSLCIIRVLSSRRRAVHVQRTGRPRAHAADQVVSGLLAALVSVLVQRGWQGKDLIPHRLEEPHALPKDFHSGARILVAKQLAEWRPARIFFRFLEAIVNIVCVFGTTVVLPYLWMPVVFMVIVFPAWFFEWTFCQLWEQPSLAFALRSRRPTLALARTVFLAGLVIVVHYDVFGLGVLQNPERRIHIGSVNVVDPWPFGFLYAEYVMNEDMAQVHFWYSCLRLGCLLLYILVLTVMVFFVCCDALAFRVGLKEKKDEARKAERVIEQKGDAMQEQAWMVKRLRMGIDNEGVRRENACWIYLDAFLVITDMFSDMVTIYQLLTFHRFVLAFFMVCIFSRSLLLQVFSGAPFTFFADVRASAEKGIRHQHFLDILQEERGFEAACSLMLTSYSFSVCV